MGLRSIWRHENDGIPQPTTRQKLNRDAISALFWIISGSIFGIILLSLMGAILRYGVIGNGTSPDGSIADESLSILGNIASAAVGGLVGWLTRDLTNESAGEGDDDVSADTGGEDVGPAGPVPAQGEHSKQRDREGRVDRGDSTSEDDASQTSTRDGGTE